jgi:hypothetical protein
MSISNIFRGAFFVGFISLFYNALIFYILDFYPSFNFGIEGLNFFGFNFYVVLFLKNFFVGMVLMVLFSFGYMNIVRDTGEVSYTLKAIFFFVLYGVFALVSFTLGDILMMETPEGMLMLLTVDGVLESFIASIPVRVFSAKSNNLAI